MIYNANIFAPSGGLAIYNGRIIHRKGTNLFITEQGDIASRKDHKCADMPGAPIAPLQGVMDKIDHTGNRFFVTETD